MLWIFLKCNRLSDPSCRCYIFDAINLNNGTFKSPNFPKIYPPDLRCILYRFHANHTDVVKITFWSFDLRKPEDGRCHDYVDLFTTINPSADYSFETSSRQLQTYPAQPADYRICGDLPSMPQTVFYSIGSVLFIIFHSASPVKQDKPRVFGGFVGQFTFIAKDAYRTDGLLEADTLCTYQIRHLSENQSQFRHGKIFSPYYPSNYPPRTHCRYYFSGAETERILLTFQSIQLNTFISETNTKYVSKCPEEGDVISIHERHNQTKMQLTRLCGQAHGVQIVTHGPNMTVEFRTNGDAFKGQGFQASYEFVHRNQVQPSPYQFNHSEPLEEVQQRDNFQVHPWVADDNSPKIGLHEGNSLNWSWNRFPPPNVNGAQNDTQIFYSKPTDAQKRGSIHSPGYPARYPLSTFKAYKFVGQPHEYIHIKILMLELGKRTRCTNFTKNFGDRMEIYDGPSNKSSLLHQICGSENSLFDQFSTINRQDQLELKSTGPYMLITFQSDSIPGENEYGFKLRFEFRNSSTVSTNFAPVNSALHGNPSQTRKSLRQHFPRNSSAAASQSIWMLLLPLCQLFLKWIIQNAVFFLTLRMHI